MAEGIFKHIMLGMVLVTLFASLMLGFVIRVGNDYSKDTSELTGGKFNLTGINRTLESLETSAKAWEADFAKQNFFSVIAGIVVTGIFTIVIGMIAAVTIPFTIILYILNDVLLVPPLVTGVLIFVFIVSLILGIWRLIRVGD